jgi:outer membrane receptor protein involved in Fe transport
LYKSPWNAQRAAGVNAEPQRWKLSDAAATSRGLSMTTVRFAQRRFESLLQIWLVFGCLFVCLPRLTLSAPLAEDTESSPPQIQEVTVTAQRRTENIQNVPVAVTAVSGEKLQAAGIGSTLDLGAITPGLEVGSALGSILPHIRGIGTTSHGPSLENSIATYVDDIYYASESASVFKLTSVAQIEVLKGP